MAQGNKSRIVIWTIVGILVVIAVVMLVSKPKNSGRPPVNPERFVRQMESRFQKLEQKVSDAQSANPGAPAEQAGFTAEDYSNYTPEEQEKRKEQAPVGFERGPAGKERRREDKLYDE
jgi:hypothetical protein